MENQPPVGNQPEFTQKALDAKFSFSFTRKQLIVLFNVLNNLQLKLGDLDSLGMEVLNGIRLEVKRSAINSITADDYVKQTNHVVEPKEKVQTN